MTMAISISLGSSKTDCCGEIDLLGTKIKFLRQGCDGNKDLAAAMILKNSLLPECRAIGLGGIDLYLYAGSKQYTLRDAKQLADLSDRVPVVDGSTIKNTWEFAVIESLHLAGLDFSGKKVLMVNAVDRPGMARALDKYAGSVIYGDVMYGLGIPFPIYNLKTIELIARVLLPIVTKCPIEWFYPIGNKQNEPRKACIYAAKADVICGDFHYINKVLPSNLKGKVIITNTVREAQIKELQELGLKTLITTTPSINGQSFGTNLLEACIVAAYGKKLNIEEMQNVLLKLDLEPGIFHLN